MKLTNGSSYGHIISITKELACGEEFIRASVVERASEKVVLEWSWLGVCVCERERET